MKINRYILGLGFVLILNAGCGSVGGGASPTGPTTPIDTTIQLESATSQASNGSTFTVSVKGYRATNLFATAFDLNFNKSFLDVTSISNGGFLSGTVDINNNYDSQTGNLVVGATSRAVSGSATGVNGDGTICTITFKAKAVGSTTISIVSGSAKFYDTNLAITTPAIGSSVDITVK